MRNALHLIIVLTAVILPMLAIAPGAAHAALLSLDNLGAVQMRIG